MKISRIKFVLLFLIFAAAFLFATNLLLDQQPESLFGSETQAGWKSTISTILSPIKIILMGPLLPFINFLHQDPDTPPPFFLVGFAFYWTILALILHYLLSKIKHSRWFLLTRLNSQTFGADMKTKNWLVTRSSAQHPESANPNPFIPTVSVRFF